MKFKFIHLPDSLIQKTSSVEKVKCLNQESNGYSAWNVPSGVETVTFGLPEHETNNSKVIGIKVQVEIQQLIYNTKVYGKSHSHLVEEVTLQW